MTINRSLVGVACAAVLVSPLLSLSSGRSIARGTVRVAAATCAQTGVPQYLVIDSRGSGEPYPPSPDTPKLDSELHKWPGELKNTSLHDASPPGEAFAAELQKLYPDSVVVVLGNPYPAVSVAGWPVLLKTTGIGAFVNGVGAFFHIGKLGAYTGSVHDGTQWLERTVQQEVASCPSTKIILTGFSQGAQATADFYQRDITAAERSHVVGVVLFGDPYFNPADKQVDRGTASATVLGFHGLLGKRRLFGNNNAKMLSYCEMWDPICDADPNKEAWLAQLALFNKVHTKSYPTDGTKAALNFQTTPPLAVLAGGQLRLVQGDASTSVAPMPVSGDSGTMGVTAFQWSGDGRYLGWEQIARSSGGGAVGWYDTLTHRRVLWSLRYFMYGNGWSVTSSGMESLALGSGANAPSTLTQYAVSGAVTTESTSVPISLTVAGYSGGFIVGPDNVSFSQLWRVSLTGKVTKLQALPKTSLMGTAYEVTAASPDGKVFVAEQGDHTDGCGVSPPSRIFVVNEAIGTIRQVPLPAGPDWRVLYLAFDPYDTLEATLVNCATENSMPTTVFSVSPAGAVTAEKQGALVATTADGDIAYQAGHAQVVAIGGMPALVEVASGALTVNGQPVADVVGAAFAAWAP